MLRKFINILLIIVALLAIFSASIFLSFKIIFSENRLKKTFKNTARGFLNRELSLKNISFGALSGLEIIEFSVSEYPDFKSGTFFKADRLLIKFKATPLLYHRMEVNEFILESPHFHFKNPVNIFSNKYYKRFNRYFSPADTAERPFAVPMFFSSKLSISDFKINRGKISFGSTQADSLHLALEDVNISADKVISTAPFKFSAKFTIEKNDIDLHFNIDGAINMADQKIKFEKASIKHRDSSLDLTGTAKDIFDKEKLSYLLDIQGDKKITEELFKLNRDCFAFQLDETDNIDMRIYGTLKDIQFHKK